MALPVSGVIDVYILQLFMEKTKNCRRRSAEADRRPADNVIDGEETNSRKIFSDCFKKTFVFYFPLNVLLPCWPVSTCWCSPKIDDPNSTTL